jgi:hypothetical protein
MVVAAMTPARIKDTWGSWRNRPYASRSDETQKRAALWQAFTDFVRENRGWIISPPGSPVAILETERGSTLPQKLVKLGYAISEVPGDFSRMTGAQLSPQAEIFRRKGHAIDFPAGITQVDRFEILLPWAAPTAPKKRP